MMSSRLGITDSRSRSRKVPELALADGECKCYRGLERARMSVCPMQFARIGGKS